MQRRRGRWWRVAARHVAAPAEIVSRSSSENGLAHACIEETYFGSVVVSGMYRSIGRCRRDGMQFSPSKQIRAAMVPLQCGDWW